MKKKTLILCLAVVLLCGCEFNKKLEHVNIKDYKTSSFVYTNSKGEDEVYAVGVTTDVSNPNLAVDEAIFYKMGENDYVILDKFEGRDGCYYQDVYTSLANDKIYIIRGEGLDVLEYTLKKENTTKKKYEFDFSLVVKEYNDGSKNIKPLGAEFESIDDQKIIFKNVTFNNTPLAKVRLKCSLLNSKCEKL